MLALLAATGCASQGTSGTKLPATAKPQTEAELLGDPRGTTDEALMRRRRTVGEIAVRLERAPDGWPPRCEHECATTLTGRYEVRADSCFEWGDELGRGYKVSILPDGHVIPASQVMLEVTDTTRQGRPGWNFVVGGDASAPPRIFALSARSSGDSSICDGCILYRDQRSAGNFGGVSGFYWTLGRGRNGALTYTVAYEARGSVVLPAKRTRRQMRCAFPLVAAG